MDLSHARFTKHTVKQAVLKDSSESRIRKKFLFALEQFQRSDRTIQRKDGQLFTNVLESSAAIEGSISRNGNYFTDYTTFSNNHDVIDLLSGIDEENDVATELFDYLMKIIQDKHTISYSLIYFGIETELVNELKEIIQKYSTNNFFIEMNNCVNSTLEECFQQNFYQTEAVKWDRISKTFSQIDKVTRDVKENKLKVDLMLSNSASNITEQLCTEALDWYMEYRNQTREHLDSNITELASKIIEYNEDPWQVDYNNIIDLVDDIGRILNETNLYGYVLDLDLRTNNVYHDDVCEASNMEDHYVTTCRCYGKSFSDAIRTVHVPARKLTSVAAKLLLEIENYFRKARRLLRKVDDVYHKKMLTLTQSVKLYEEGNITKLEMYQQYKPAQRTFDLFLDYIADLDVSLEQILRLISDVEDNLIEVHRIMFKQHIPYITKSNYNETVLGKLLLQHKHNPKYETYINNFEVNFKTDYIALMREHFTQTKQSFTSALRGITDDADDVVMSLLALKEELSMYERLTVMDHKFYL